MPKLALYNVEGDEVGGIELKEEIFGVPVNQTVLHQVIVGHLAAQRRGTHDTKTRAEVRGGGRKPWRQKGTGRARHGSIRSPIWRGGGIVFGPHPRDYSYSIPKKVKRLALKSALSSKVEDNNIKILDEIKLERPQTKEMIRILNNLKINKKVLVVTAEKDENLEKSVRNIPGVKPATVSALNTYDLMAYPVLVITKEAADRIEEVLA